MSDSKDLVRVDVVEPTDVIPAISTFSGAFLRNIHKPSACVGRPCCIHDPSDHPLRDARMYWRDDLRIMERICEHRIGHPDPDDVRVRTVGGLGVHTCDGCCRSRHDDGVT